MFVGNLIIGLTEHTVHDPFEAATLMNFLTIVIETTDLQKIQKFDNAIARNWKKLKTFQAMQIFSNVKIFNRKTNNHVKQFLRISATKKFNVQS